MVSLAFCKKPSLRLGAALAAPSTPSTLQYGTRMAHHSRMISLAPKRRCCVGCVWTHSNPPHISRKCASGHEANSQSGRDVLGARRDETYRFDAMKSVAVVQERKGRPAAAGGGEGAKEGGLQRRNPSPLTAWPMGKRGSRAVERAAAFLNR